MNSIGFIKLAATTMVLGTTLVGCGPSSKTMHLGNASDKAMKGASRWALLASKAIDKKDFATAVDAAETAVEQAPRDAGYRMLLGQAYLGAGRFASAGSTFADVLTLTPDDGRAALNLALTQIARGRSGEALGTLNDYHDKLGTSDLGLATALAGDVEGAVRLLEAAVRSPDADAKARQNLALAYAMAGKWTNARVMAVMDLTPSDADARVIEWMTFVRPSAASDQVASLLGVSPIEDAGQPTRLALGAAPAKQVAMALDAPVPISGVVKEEVTAGPVRAASVVDVPPPAFEVASAAPKPLPVAQIAAAPSLLIPLAAPVASTAAARPGKFVVQIGAFANLAVARSSWGKAAQRYALADYAPATATARVRGARYVRVSIGGFGSRPEAAGLCVKIKAAGGSCFVRSIAGDAPMQWVAKGLPKLASR